MLNMTSCNSLGLDSGKTCQRWKTLKTIDARSLQMRPDLTFHVFSFTKVAASCGDKVVLGGSSMGAASAVYAALQNPEKVFVPH